MVADMQRAAYELPVHQTHLMEALEDLDVDSVTADEAAAWVGLMEGLVRCILAFQALKAQHYSKARWLMVSGALPVTGLQGPAAPVPRRVACRVPSAPTT